MKRNRLLVCLVAAVAFLVPVSVGGEFVPPEFYGRVVIGNFSPQAGMAKVVFDHWLHRSQFTCRVCHVDIGFSMEAGGTRFRAADNMKGFYCGSCHNGKMMTYDGMVFRACSTSPTAEERARCDRCHSFGKKVASKYVFRTFAEKLPKASLGNGIDWVKAEESGLIAPKDFVPGISIKKQAMPVRKDFSLGSKSTMMSDIIFSHKKHTKWTGCEACHPDIFLGVSKGATKYYMIQIYGGQYCGVCHLAVAFPLQDCSRCHTKPVR